MYKYLLLILHSLRFTTLQLEFYIQKILFGNSVLKSQNKTFVWSKKDLSERKKTKQNFCCEKITPILRRFSEQNCQNVFFVVFGGRLRTGLNGKPNKSKLETDKSGDYGFWESHTNPTLLRNFFTISHLFSYYLETKIS